MDKERNEDEGENVFKIELCQKMLFFLIRSKFMPKGGDCKEVEFVYESVE